MAQQEIKDIAIQAAASAPTSVYALATGLTLAEWIAIGMALLQAVYLLRKWWREESEWGMRLKRWAGRHGITKPMELDE